MLQLLSYFWCFKLITKMLIYLHYFAVLTLDPIIGAISAGNVVVIKPSEQSPASSSFLATTIPRYLDSNAIKVIEGGPDVCEQLLLQKWDKIFFTGIIFYTKQCHLAKLWYIYNVYIYLLCISKLIHVWGNICKLDLG